MHKQQISPAKRGPRHIGRAAIVVGIILLVTLAIMFGLRQAWHADEQQEDPASLQAPDRAQGGQP